MSDFHRRPLAISVSIMFIARSFTLEAWAQETEPNLFDLFAVRECEEYHGSSLSGTLKLNELPEWIYPEPWKRTDLRALNGAGTLQLSSPFFDPRGWVQETVPPGKPTATLVRPDVSEFDLKTLLPSDADLSARNKSMRSGFGPLVNTQLRPSHCASTWHIIGPPSFLPVVIGANGSDTGSAGSGDVDADNVTLEFDHQACGPGLGGVGQEILQEISKHAKSTGFVVVASTTEALAREQPRFPSVVHTQTQDGNSQLVFRNLTTFDEEIANGGLQLCPAPSNICEDGVRALRGSVALRGCGGVILNDSLGRLVLATADHCVPKSLIEGVEMFVLFDYVRNSAGLDLENGTFTSNSFMKLDNSTALFGADISADFEGQAIAYLYLAGDLPLGVVPAKVAKSLPDLNARVVAMTYPLGVPLTPAAGLDTFVYGLSADRKTMLMTIDNFSGSSGGPVFLEGGDLLGVFSKVPIPQDIETSMSCVKPVQILLAEEVDIPSILAHVVSVVGPN